MKIHLVATSVFLLAPALPAGAQFAEGLGSIRSLQRFQAFHHERMSPGDCQRYYRSFEVRTRMSTSERRKGLEGCLAAQEPKSPVQVADSAVRPEPRAPEVRPVSTRPAPLEGDASLRLDVLGVEGRRAPRTQ